MLSLFLQTGAASEHGGRGPVRIGARRAPKTNIARRGRLPGHQAGAQLDDGGGAEDNIDRAATGASRRRVAALRFKSGDEVSACTCTCTCPCPCPCTCTCTCAIISVDAVAPTCPRVTDVLLARTISHTACSAAAFSAGFPAERPQPRRPPRVQRTGAPRATYKCAGKTRISQRFMQIT